MNAWDVMAWARRTPTGSPGRKAVLMVLAEHADEARSCFPSQATIAEATEQSVRTVRSQLADLEAAGLIRREHRGNGQGGRSSDRYYLLVPPAESAPNPAPIAASAEGVTGKSAGGNRQAVADEQPDVEPHLEQTPAVDHARAVATAVWEGRNPKPAGKGAYMGLVAVARALLDAGHPQPVVQDAMLQVPTVTIRAVEFHIGKAKPKRATVGPMDSDRDAPAGRLDL